MERKKKKKQITKKEQVMAFHPKTFAGGPCENKERRAPIVIDTPHFGPSRFQQTAQGLSATGIPIPLPTKRSESKRSEKPEIPPSVAPFLATTPVTQSMMRPPIAVVATAPQTSTTNDVDSKPKASLPTEKAVSAPAPTIAEEDGKSKSTSTSSTIVESSTKVTEPPQADAVVKPANTCSADIVMPDTVVTPTPQLIPTHSSSTSS